MVKQNKRLNQVNHLLQTELGEIILREFDFSQNIVVTITAVKASSDLKYAECFVSVFPILKSQLILKSLQKKIALIQQLVRKRMVMHHVPKIIFKLDETEEKATKIEELLDSLKDNR